MALRGEGPTLVGVLWFEVVLNLAVIILRLYTRTVLRASVGADDYLIIVTWVCTYASVWSARSDENA